MFTFVLIQTVNSPKVPDLQIFKAIIPYNLKGPNELKPAQ